MKLAIALILAVLFSRLLPHPVNFSPVVAVAALAPLALPSFGLAVGVSLLGMLLSDLVLGFHPYIFFTYGALLLIAALSRALRPRHATSVLATGLLGSFVFFAVSNFGYWLLSGAFPYTPAGFAQCLVAALPFFPQQLLGDLIYIGLLSGVYFFLRNAVAFVGERRYKSLP